MTVPKTKTNYDETIKRINELLAGGSYLREDNLAFLSVMRSADQLMQVDARSAHIAKAAAYQLCGNIKMMNEHFDIAYALGDKRRVSMEKATGTLNLGYFSEALKLFSEYADPIYGDLASIIHIGHEAFGFETLAKCLEKAKNMNINTEYANAATYERANAILKEFDITQSQVAEYADVAGEIFRENRLITMGNVVIEPENDPAELPCVYITFYVKTSHDKAADLFDELITRLYSRYETIPSAVHFSIRAVA